MAKPTMEEAPAYVSAFKEAYAAPEHRRFYSDGGEAAVLMVHGFPGTPSELRSLAGAFAGLGWSVDVPLLPGFGTDIETLFERTCGDWLEAIREAYRALEETHCPVVLGGYSMGGAIATAVAPELDPDGLILLSPFWRLPFDRPLLRLLSPLLRLVVPRIHPFRLMDLDMDEIQTEVQELMPDLDLQKPEMQAELHDLAIPTRLFAELSELGRSAFKAAPAVTAPTLILQGIEDELVSATNTRKLLVRLSGPVEYLEVPAGHDLFNNDADTRSHITPRILAFATQIANTVSERDRLC